MSGLSHADRRQPIATAPRNGLTIIVGHDDCGQFAMHWEPGAENWLIPGARGFWVSLDRSFTWSEHDGAGPDFWFHLPAESGADDGEAVGPSPHRAPEDEHPAPTSPGEPK